MKNNISTSCKIIPFCPNAKNKQYYIDKLLDISLTAATSMGIVTVLLFFVLL